MIIAIVITPVSSSRIIINDNYHHRDFASFCHVSGQALRSFEPHEALLSLHTESPMAARKKVLLKVIILGDSG